MYLVTLRTQKTPSNSGYKVKLKQNEDKIRNEMRKRAKRAAKGLAALASSRTNGPPSIPGGYPGVKTGRLTKSFRGIVIEKDGGFVIKLTNKAKYSAIVNNGSRGGTLIRPRKAKALRFMWHGKRVITQGVIRGDVAPRPFFKLAPEDYRAEFFKIMRQKLPGG